MTTDYLTTSDLAAIAAFASSVDDALDTLAEAVGEPPDVAGTLVVSEQTFQLARNEDHVRITL